MEYKYKPKNEKMPHWLRFVGDEAVAVRAMYIEEAVTRIANGNSDFIGPFEEHTAESASKRKKDFCFTIDDLGMLAAKLEAFF